MSSVSQQSLPSVGGAAVSRPTSSMSVQLTRHGRLALVSLCVGIAAVVGVVLAGPVVADEPGTPPTTNTVVVVPGDTLWDIARRIAPSDDPRSTIYEIRRLNGLAGAEIRVGDVLVVPLR